MRTADESMHSQWRERGAVALLSGLCLLVAWWIANASIKAWLVVGAVAALALLEIEPVYWCAGAVCAATLIRLATALGAPHFLNFLHFPLILGGLVVAVLKGKSSRFSTSLGYGLTGFLIVNIISWSFNGGEMLRPLLDWFVLAEPFLLVYAMSLSPIEFKQSRLLWQLLLGISGLQLPFALYQWSVISHGNPDRVQGTFIGQGAGAHIAGAMALLGVLIAICRATVERSRSERSLLYVAAALLFTVAVLADAKQAVLAFVVGIAFTIALATGNQWTRFLLPAVAMSLVLVAAFLLYTPLELIFNQALISGGVQGKVVGAELIASRLLDHQGGWLLGAGPGNSVSRVSLLTSGASLDVSSPISALHLKTAPLTRELLAASAGNYLWSSSSAFSAEASWFGLVGDLGLLGLVVYIYLALVCWRGTNSGLWQSAACKGTLISALLLGGISSWLEEPGFVLPVALLISLSQTDSSRRQ